MLEFTSRRSLANSISPKSNFDRHRRFLGPKGSTGRDVIFWLPKGGEQKEKKQNKRKNKTKGGGSSEGVGKF